MSRTLNESTQCKSQQGGKQNDDDDDEIAPEAEVKHVEGTLSSKSDTSDPEVAEAQESVYSTVQSSLTLAALAHAYALHADAL